MRRLADQRRKDRAQGRGFGEAAIEQQVTNDVFFQIAAAFNLQYRQKVERGNRQFFLGCPAAINRSLAGARPGHHGIHRQAGKAHLAQQSQRHFKDQGFPVLVARTPGRAPDGGFGRECCIVWRSF